MPTGNTLGARKYFKYESDSGENFSYLTDNDLGVVAGATPDDTFAAFPRRFKPRIVYVEATIAGVKTRKSLIVPTNDSTLYAALSSQEIPIDSVTFKTTGRRGEKASFANN